MNWTLPRVLIAGALSVALIGYGIAALVIGSWSLTNLNNKYQYQYQQKVTNQQAHIAQNNYGSQEGYIGIITSDVSQIDGILAAIPSEPVAQQGVSWADALGVGNQACYEATLLTGSVSYSPTMHRWIGANCAAGAVSLTSPLRLRKGN